MTSIDLIKDNIPDIRFLYDLKDVLFDREWLKSAPNLEVYYMYRGLSANPKDKQTMDNGNLRYDITIIIPRMFGAEYPKTLGHEHAAVNRTNLTYPEIYEILQGEGKFLLQKRSGDMIKGAYVVEARQGEKVIIPPAYAHVTINASGQELIIANWSEKNFKSDYRPIKEKKGACYYALSSKALAKEDALSSAVIPSEPATSPPVIPSPSTPLRVNPARNLADNNIVWAKNTNYASVSDLKIHQAADFNNLIGRFGINPAKPMYELVNEIGKLDFLKNPQKYEWK